MPRHSNRGPQPAGGESRDTGVSRCNNGTLTVCFSRYWSVLQCPVGPNVSRKMLVMLICNRHWRHSSAVHRPHHTFGKHFCYMHYHKLAHRHASQGHCKPFHRVPCVCATSRGATHTENSAGPPALVAATSSARGVAGLPLEAGGGGGVGSCAAATGWGVGAGTAGVGGRVPGALTEDDTMRRLRFSVPPTRVSWDNKRTTVKKRDARKHK